MAVGYFTFDGNDDLETADKAALDITGDLEIIIACRIDDWADTTIQTLVSKWENGSNTESWILRQLQSTNIVELVWMESDDTTTHGPNSGTFSLLGDGVDGWIRVTLDVDNGGNWQAKYYESTDALTTAPGSVSWTDVSTWNGTGTTDINAGTADLAIGWRADEPAGEAFSGGRIYGVWIYDGIGGTLVADPDFRDGSQGNWASLPVTDDQSNSWSAVAGAPAYTPSDDKAPATRRPIVVHQQLARRHSQVFA